MTVIDLWVNLLSPEVARAMSGEYFGQDVRPEDPDELVGIMDRCGVDVGVLTGGLSGSSVEDLLKVADNYPGRFLVAGTVDKATRPVRMAARVRDLAQHERFVFARVTPLVEQLPLNHRLYYPVYAACAEAGLPVSINIGVPGPQVRSGCQHPEMLEDVLIDFPGMTVIGAHMGHPYEELLMTYMRKWPTLYLSNSAYLAKYLDPALVTFMNSSIGKGRVLFASDHPFLPLDRALAAARSVPGLADDAKEAFLGAGASLLA
ncbi:MAG TPA: amidohydrolase family protein [Acidimicrobiales bacterium]|nr:amidohydrolase family protein [Acidimicrobiales bacterium]